MKIKFKVYDKVNKCWVPFNPMWADFDSPDYEYCQFTGVCDKNGEEIYIGDVIKYKEWQPLNPIEVRWAKVSEDNYPGIVMGNLSGEFEIVGNVFENENS